MKVFSLYFGTEVLVTCQPPGTETYPDVILSLNRTLYYVDEKIYFECPEKEYIPSINSTKCLQNGSFEQLAVKYDSINFKNVHLCSFFSAKLSFV